jgi:hypothetical protein
MPLKPEIDRKEKERITMRKTNVWLMLAGLIIAAGLLVGWR